MPHSLRSKNHCPRPCEMHPLLDRARLVSTVSRPPGAKRPGPFANSRHDEIQMEFRDGGCNEVRSSRRGETQHTEDGLVLVLAISSRRTGEETLDVTIDETLDAYSWGLLLNPSRAKEEISLICCRAANVDIERA